MADRPTATLSVNGVPLQPSKQMIEAGAQRLVRWETGKEKWPAAWRNTPHSERTLGAVAARKAEIAKSSQKRSHGAVLKPSDLKLTEKQVLKGCLAVLRVHPAVELFWRQNVGVGSFTGGLTFSTRRWVRFGFRGCSDILGMLVGGRFLAIECKASGKPLSPDQDAFLSTVRLAGGFAAHIDDPAELFNALDAINAP